MAIGIFVATARSVCPSLAAEEKPLVNADVIQMVENGLPEGTIVRAVQTSENDFDVSASGLIALNRDGVSEKILDAMIVAARKNAGREIGRASRATRPSGGTSRTAGATSRRQPSVTLLDGETKSVLPLGRTALAQTQAEPQSLAALSKDKLIDGGIRTATGASRRSGSTLGRTTSEAAKSVAGMFRPGDSKTLTYIWILDKETASTDIANPSPVFEVALNETIGVHASDYAPVVVKLTPTPRGALLVGATQGKTGATSNRTLDWPLYSTFIEDRVESQLHQGSSGVWSVTVTTPLQPGDYGVVLRPIARDKKYSGADVARNQGDGLAFNAVWPFTVR